MGEDERVFLRGISSDQYGAEGFRRMQRSAPRVVKGGWKLDAYKAGYGDHGKQSVATWLVGPGDEPFRTQTLQAHTVEIVPGGTNAGHGHQNEAFFYILEGRGYDIHDGKRYEWQKDDVVIVHNDSAHKHYNASTTERAVALVIKAKAAWMYLGLMQQGRLGPAGDGLGPREDWSRLWSPGVQARKKIITPADATWADTEEGRVRVLTSAARTDQRAHSVDLYQQEIAPGARSPRHWHMADELAYVMRGRGHSLHWDVEAEIDDKYYAHVATTPSRWDVQAGELLYMPPNTVHQHVNDGDEPLLLLSGQNRLFKLLGYDSVVYLEDASVMPAPAAAAAR
jgi:quercetin dioxygenase-like cupin family protein